MAVLENGFNVIIKKKVGDKNTNIYPITSTSNVFNVEGKTLDTVIDEIKDSQPENGVPDFSGETVSDLRFLRNDNSWANIQSASINQAGVVQLSNSDTDTSETKAPNMSLFNQLSESVKTSTNNITNIQTELTGVIHNTSLGIASGVATLDESGKVPSAQLPSYVDDVVEFSNYSVTEAGEGSYNYVLLDNEGTELVGEAGKIYVYDGTPLPESSTVPVDKILKSGECFRWSGSIFAKIVAGGVTLGETSFTAFDGLRGKAAYDHSISDHARTDATAVTSSQTNGNVVINGTETVVYSHPTGETETNPHGTTKSDVGLSNVENKSAAEIIQTITSDDITNKLGYVPVNPSVTASESTSGAMSSAQAVKLEGLNKVDVLESDPTEDGIFFVIQS